MSIDDWVVGSTARERFPLFTRANVGEVFPDPVMPLSDDWLIRGAEDGWRDAWVRMGAFDHDEFNPDDLEVLGIFGSYCYLNASIIRLFGERAPGMSAQTMDDQFFGAQPGIPPYEVAEGDVRPDLTEKIGATLAWAMSAPELDDVAADERTVRGLRDARPDLTAMSDRELVAYARQLGADHHQHLFEQHIFITYMASVPLAVISAVCEAVGRPTDTLRLVAGVGDVESAAPSMAMWELGRLVAASPTVTAAFEEGVAGLDARLRAATDADSAAFVEAFDGFLYRFGTRGPNEWEMRCATWELEPELALAAIDRMRLAPADADPAAQGAVRAEERERVAKEILGMVEGDPEAHGQLSAALAAAKVFMAGRERTKTNNISMIHEARMAMWELGRRMVAAGRFDDPSDFALLRSAELEELLDGADMSAVIRGRRSDFLDLSQRQEPFIVIGEAQPPSMWPPRGADVGAPVAVGDALPGVPGCPGSAQGRARVVLDSHDPSALSPGDVLVAPITDPSWTPLFVTASAVVVDVGAPLSHAVIVSRELGIPCVVSATDATKRIVDGALVEVDGDTGVVTVLDGP
ncbi:MAG: PEP-utilizing enzyme [Actinomycetota bacterium]